MAFFVLGTQMKILKALKMNPDLVPEVNLEKDKRTLKNQAKVHENIVIPDFFV